MFKVDVDIGRLLALATYESFEEQIDLDGINRRDAKTEADNAVGRRPSTLAEDAARSCESHDVMYG